MLAARSSTRRLIGRRSFASVVDSAGVKVAAVDYNTPTSSVTFLVNAGSRYETVPGVAHALKNFAFKGTAKRSALGTVRESELYGGVLSSTLSREHLALTAEFLRGDEDLYFDILSSFVTSGKYARHEFTEYVQPSIEDDVLAAESNPATQAFEAAHNLAFRSGLGASLFSPHHGPTHADIRSYASSVFTKGNIAVLGTGIDQNALTQLADKYLGGIAAGNAAAATPSKYFGGENRIAGHPHAGGLQTVFIGFGASGAPAPELAALAAHLAPVPQVKWSTGPTSSYAAEIPLGVTVKPIYLPYTDAALVGVLVQGEDAEKIKVAGSAAVKALKAAAGNLKAEDVKKAATKAKFDLAGVVDGREGFVSLLGAKVLAGEQSSLDGTVSALDKVTASTFSKTISALLKSKPTYVAVGDTASLPFADELGL